MLRLTEACLRHRGRVLAGWLVLLAVGFAVLPGLAGRLTLDFSLPGRPVYETNRAIVARYGGGGAQVPTVLVTRLPAGTTVDTPGVLPALARGDAAVVAALGRNVPVASYAATRDRAFSSDDGRTTVALVSPPLPRSFSAPDPGPRLRDAFTAAAALPPGTTTQATGLNQLRSSGGNGGSGVLLEALLGGVGALLILAFVFGSFLAVVPLVVAAVSILTTFSLVDLLTTVTPVSFIVQFLVALIGLGVAIDYSLLTVTRWREERAAGRGNDDAVRAAMATAGQAVVFSGLTVAVGPFSLVVLRVPFLRSVGYGGVLIPLVSVAVSSTLLPVLLSRAGPLLDRPRIRRGGSYSRPWAAWARLVVRRRVLGALAALAVVLALGIPALRLQVGDPRSSSLAAEGPAYDGLRTLTDAGIPSGVLTPVEVLVRSGEPAAVAARPRQVPGVRGAAVTGRQPGDALVTVLPVAETSARPGSDLVDRIRAALPGEGIAGAGAADAEFNRAVYGSFPLMVGLIVAATFVLLVRAFRSVLLAIKAVLLNLLSVGATYGALVLV